MRKVPPREAGEGEGVEEGQAVEDGEGEGEGGEDGEGEGEGAQARKSFLVRVGQG